MEIIHDGWPVFPLIAAYESASGESIISVNIGTCFAISKEGKFLTASHVIERTPKSVNVQGVDMKYTFKMHSIIVQSAMNSEKTLWPVVEHQDCGNDIGLITCALNSGKRKLKVNNPFNVRQQHDIEMGRQVCWYGFSANASPKFTADEDCMEVVHTQLWILGRCRNGIISSIYTVQPPFGPDLPLPSFELDSPVTPGMSGGPLIDLNSGEVIGILSKSIEISVHASLSDGSGTTMLKDAIGIAVDIIGFSFC
ncbi:MAG: hypothetical protein FD174_3587 [Geobacteraceae bacterium]|nr:MAG: hypothetical protein FD174_3587 [Geobacteraceae bacterium]